MSRNAQHSPIPTMRCSLVHDLFSHYYYHHFYYYEMCCWLGDLIVAASPLCCCPCLLLNCITSPTVFTGLLICDVGKREKKSRRRKAKFFLMRIEKRKKKYSFTSREKKREKVGATCRSLLRMRKKKAPLWRYRYVII